jgi:hypothetical protein
MMKAKTPVRIASPEAAAREIIAAIRKRAKHAYITRRWAIVAFILKRRPRPSG